MRSRFLTRFMIWVSIIVVGQSPALSGAQTRSELNRRLLAVENKLKESPPISDDQKAYLKNVEALKAKFEDLRSRLDQTADKMEQTAEHVSGKEMDINNSYFAMLSLLLAVAGIAVAVVGTFAFFILENIVARRVIEKTTKVIEGEIKARAFYETALARADTFAALAYAWYDHYAKQFHTSLRTGTLPTVTVESGLARNLSRKGMATIDGREFIAASKDDPRAWIARATLVNLLVYNSTAHLLCLQAAGNIPNENEEITNLLVSAESCMALARDERARDRHWYDLHQTAAFAMIKMGNQGTQARGRALMLDLLDGTTPSAQFTPPGLGWRQDLWDDCFATPTGTSDLLNLGRMAPRPA